MTPSAIRLTAPLADSTTPRTITAVPFRVSDGVQAGARQTLAGWAADTGEDLRETCVTLSEMADAGLLAWDAGRGHVLMTVPVR